MTANRNTSYISYLQDIVRLYNNTSHKGILNFKPIDIYNGQHQKEIYELNICKIESNQKFKRNIVHIGEKVRFAMRKNRFNKGYEQNYSKNVFTITDIIDREHCKLSNNHIYRNQDILIVPQNADSIDEDAITQEHTQNKINRELRKLS